MDILHVEDDPDLADVLKQSLEHFGFAGRVMHATGVDDAFRIIDAAERIDIVFSDMNLADGTGLDVIRHVRAHSRWGNTPIVILSSDMTPGTLGDAYALGANSYVLKSPRQRTPLEVIKSLYEHWLKDVVLPPRNQSGAREMINQLAKLRERHSAIYLQLAQRFPNAADFWLARALNQTNRSNLLRFLRANLDAERVFPRDLLATIEQSIRDQERGVTAIERSLRRRPPATLDEASALILQLVALGDDDVQLRGLSIMFPFSRAAAAALLDSWATNLELVATWIDANTQSDELRAKVSDVRARAAHLRQASEEYERRWDRASTSTPPGPP